MYAYQRTVSNEDDRYNPIMEKLVKSTGVWYSITETKDGTVYDLEFESHEAAKGFLDSVKKIPLDRPRSNES